MYNEIHCFSIKFQQLATPLYSAKQRTPLLQIWIYVSAVKMPLKWDKNRAAAEIYVSIGKRLSITHEQVHGAAHRTSRGVAHLIVLAGGFMNCQAMPSWQFVRQSKATNGQTNIIIITKKTLHKRDQQANEREGVNHGKGGRGRRGVRTHPLANWCCNPLSVCVARGRVKRFLTRVIKQMTRVAAKGGGGWRGEVRRGGKRWADKCCCEAFVFQLGLRCLHCLNLCLA